VGAPGKKLLFMGCEFGQRREWAHDEGLEWFVLAQHEHSGVQRWIGDLNRVYRAEPALYDRISRPRASSGSIARTCRRAS
jgi:1,4-alpha-glucan branching enzyme